MSIPTNVNPDQPWGIMNANVTPWAGDATGIRMAATGVVSYDMPDGSIILQMSDGEVRHIQFGSDGSTLEYNVELQKGDPSRKGEQFQFGPLPRKPVAMGKGNAQGLILPQTRPIVTLATIKVYPDAVDPPAPPETEAEVTSADVAKAAAEGIKQGAVSAVTGLIDLGKLAGEGIWYIVSDPVETGKALAWGAGQAKDALGQWMQDALFPVIDEIATNPGNAWKAAKMMGSDMADYVAQHPDKFAHGAGEFLGNLVGGEGIGKLAGGLGTLGRVADEVPAPKPVPKPKPVEKPAKPDQPAAPKEPPKPKGEGGYVERKQPNCFKPQKLPEDKLPELDQQLREQQDAINQMTAEDYLKAREMYDKFKRNPAARKANAELRRGFSQKEMDKIVAKLRRSGLSKVAAVKQAQNEVNEMMKALDALHIPDMSAGGWHQPTPVKMGNAEVNQTIGRQWAKEGRLKNMDAIARNTPKGGTMNVKLERCK